MTINISAEKLADLFFDKWYCENGLPLEIISDRDKLFLSKFWTHLHKLTGVKIKMSTAYHPKTDGASERSNKTGNSSNPFPCQEKPMRLGLSLAKSEVQYNEYY